MWPVIGGLISGLGNFFGAEQTNQQSAANVQAQNAANMQMQQQAENFNQAQAQTQMNYNTQIMEDQQAFNAQQVQQQEAFQTGMSNTAYQRASADMKAAGLNPMMMFGSGSAASTPSGGAATSSAPSGASASISPMRMERPQYASPISSVGDVIGKVVSTAVQAKTLDKMADEMANLEAQNAQIKAATLTEGERAVLTSKQATKTAAETAGVLSTNRVLENSAKSADNQLSINPSIRQAADVAAYLGKRASDVVAPITGLISGAKGVSSIINDRWP